MPENSDLERWLCDYQHLVEKGWANSSSAAEDAHEEWITAMRERLVEDDLLAKIEVILDVASPEGFPWEESCFVALARLLTPTGGPNYPNPAPWQPDYEEKRRRIVEWAERDWGETLKRARARIASELEGSKEKSRLISSSRSGEASNR